MYIAQQITKKVILGLSLLAGLLLAALLPAASGDAREAHSIFSVAQADVPAPSGGYIYIDSGNATSATSSSSCSSDSGSGSTGGNGGDADGASSAGP